MMKIYTKTQSLKDLRREAFPNGPLTSIMTAFVQFGVVDREVFFSGDRG
jgi:hypothetical protein